jgi:hypothetical protein
VAAGEEKVVVLWSFAGLGRRKEMSNMYVLPGVLHEDNRPQVLVELAGLASTLLCL